MSHDRRAYPPHHAAGRAGRGGAAVLAAASRGEGAGAAMAQLAARTKPAGSDLGAIEHVVFLMQENRSFDHYYGTFGGVRASTTTPRAPRELRPGLAGRPRPDAPPLPSRLEVRHRRVHPGPRPQLAGRAPELGQGHQRRLRVDAHQPQFQGPTQGVFTMGYYTPRRPPVLLRAGRRVHHLRQLSLLGPRADAPEPAHVALGHHRPDRRRGRPGAHHQRGCRRRLQRALGHHARGARGRRGELEGLQPRGHHLHPATSSRSTASSATPSSPTSASTRTRIGAVPEGLPAAVPERLRERHPSGTLPAVSWLIPPVGYDEHPSSPPALGEWYTSQVLSALVSNPRCGPRPSCSTCTTRTTASSTTCRRPSRRTARRANPSQCRRCRATPSGFAGPVGMGFRVPMLVLSPFSRGGHVASRSSTTPPSCASSKSASA